MNRTAIILVVALAIALSSGCNNCDNVYYNAKSYVGDGIYVFTMIKGNYNNDEIVKWDKNKEPVYFEIMIMNFTSRSIFIENLPEIPGFLDEAYTCKWYKVVDGKEECTYTVKTEKKIHLLSPSAIFYRKFDKPLSGNIDITELSSYYSEAYMLSVPIKKREEQICDVTINMPLIYYSMGETERVIKRIIVNKRFVFE